MPTSNKGVVALRADNGRVAWGYEVNSRFFATPVAVDANGDKVKDILLAQGPEISDVVVHIEPFEASKKH